MTQKTVSIGCASAFWGDTGAAAKQLVSANRLDYLVFDYLAEVTMSILAGARLKNPELGYATDFVDTLKPLLPKIAKQNIKVISNAGGVNPKACAQAIESAIEAAGLSLKVALISGDDLSTHQASLKDQDIHEMYTQAPLPDLCVSVNAYLGATTVQQALDLGADIVITGRVVDSAIVLGPLMHEFNWQPNQFDQLAQGSLAGHIIECGCQCTGGNFTDWQDVPGFENMGFPIIECFEDGSFVVSKPDNTGGLINRFTVGEQLLYEISDPANYQLPDVNCDFTQVHLEEISKNQVKVTGAKGHQPSEQYKVAATYMDGNRCTVSFLMAGIDADKKAERVAKAIIRRVSGIYAALGWSDFDDYDIEILGNEATYGAQRNLQHSREVVVKIAAKHQDKKALGLFAREIAPAATSMAPGISGMVGGRPKVSPVIRLFSFLIDKSQVSASVEFEGKRYPLNTSNSDQSEIKDRSKAQSKSNTSVETTEALSATLPLIKLAVARSGDKGDSCNIGIMARKPEYLEYIKHTLSEHQIRKYLAHVLTDQSDVTRFELSGIAALNFNLTFALGGGGIASLRTDPQGKAMAQQLLEHPIAVPKALEQALSD